MRRGNRLALDSRGGSVIEDGLRVCSLGNRDVWARWRWDGEVLEIRNCDLGFQPLYYRQTPTGIRVADDPLETFDPGQDVALDTRALAAFLRLGFFVGEDTPFRGVRQLPPSATLTWSHHRGMQVHVGDRAAGLPTHVDRHRALRAYADLLRQGIQERLPLTTPVYVPLSGGRDSRHIAFALHETGVRPDAFVTGQRVLCGAAPAEDVRIALMLAKALETPHIVLPPPKSLVHAMCRAMDESGLCSDEGAWAMPLLDFLQEQGATIYDGLGGDVMSAGLFQTPDLHSLLTSGDTRRAAEHVVRTWAAGGWAQLLDDELRQALSAEVAIKVIAEEMERHVGHRNPVRAFYFWNRTRREMALAPFKLLAGAAATVETPYLYRPLWTFLDGLPYEMVADHEFHTAAIHLAYPQFAHLPFEDKSARQDTRFSERLAFTLAFLGHTVLRRTLRLDRMRLAKRSIGLLKDMDPWWSPTMVLYLTALLAARPR